MKKLFLTFLFGLTVLSVSAQQPIVIDNSDMPAPGDKPRFSIADTIFGLDLSQTGPNYLWDFSTLNPILQRTDSFVGRSDLPLTLRFTAPSDLSVAQYINNPDSLGVGGFVPTGGYDLYRSKSPAFESLGQAAVLNGILPIFFEKDPIDTVYRFPLSFTDRDSSYSEAVLNLNIPTLGEIYVFQQRNRVNEVDGWGTLMTPYGTFDVLRVKTYITGYDSIKFDTTLNFAFPAIPTTTYSWLAKGEGVPVMQVSVRELGGLGLPGQITYRDSLREGVPTVGIEDRFEPLAATVYPNPAKDFARIDLGEANGKPATLRLVSLTGKVLQEILIPGRSHELDLQGLAAGVYLLRIDRDEQVFLGKLVVE